MPNPTTPNSAVILERIDNLRADIADLKAQVSCLNESQFRFEKTYVEKHADVLQLASQANHRLDTLEPEVKELADSIKPLVFQSRIIAWLSVALGASVFALIWSIITHQVTIVIP